MKVAFQFLYYMPVCFVKLSSPFVSGTAIGHTCVVFNQLSTAFRAGYTFQWLLLISWSRLLINIYRALNELNALNCQFWNKGGSLPGEVSPRSFLTRLQLIKYLHKALTVNK